MKSFVVIGAGRYGDALARRLYILGNEVLVIDIDPEKTQRIADSVTHAVTADAKSESVLRSLGVKNYDCAVVAIGGVITDSVLIALALKEIGLDMVVCKAQSDAHGRILEKIGVDSVVYPEREMGGRTAQKLSAGNIFEYMELSDEYGIAEIASPKKWVGRSLMELDVRRMYGVTILAVTDGHGGNPMIAPPADYLFKESDDIVVFGAYEDIAVVQQL